MPKPLIKCIFCGTMAPPAAEHILPKALHKLVPRTMAKYRTLDAVQHHTHSEFRARSKLGDPRDWKVPCVCHGCNNGWMHRLDVKSRPLLIKMINGNRIDLNINDQTTLAAWASMKSIVAEHFDPGWSSTHHMKRRRLMKKQLPPERYWVVWIGFVPRKNWTPTWRYAPFSLSSEQNRLKLIARTGSDRTTKYNGKTWTQVFGQVLFHIIHTPRSSMITDRPFPPLPNGGALIPIWPLRFESIPWPQAGLYRGDVLFVMDAFRNYLVAAQKRRRAVERT